MDEGLRALQDLFGERIQYGLPMKGFTALGIGGPIKALIAARTQADLITAISAATEEDVPYLLLGGGSNLLVADEGVDRLVVKNEFAGVSREGNLVTAFSGTVLQDIVDFSLREGLSGIHKMTGIPGTVGGAVYGNAGAYGQTISDHLEEVDVFDGKHVLTFGKADCRFAYRWSAFKENRYTVLAVRLRLQPADAAGLAAESHAILTQRLAKYPVGLKCPGSFFMNVLAANVPPATLALLPPEKIIHGKIPAGYLLEQVGAKGQSLGGIQISPTNANLFINRGDGRAEEFVRLASTYAAKVKEKFGIELTPEVQLINLPPLQLAAQAVAAEAD